MPEQTIEDRQASKRASPRQQWKQLTAEELRQLHGQFQSELDALWERRQLVHRTQLPALIQRHYDCLTALIGELERSLASPSPPNMEKDPA